MKTVDTPANWLAYEWCLLREFYRQISESAIVSANLYEPVYSLEQMRAITFAAIVLHRSSTLQIEGT